MTTYLALFRGINIGGHNRITMKDLVAVFEDLKCKNIRTYIQSGNVIFDTENRSRNNLISDISLAVEQGFGFCPKVILLKEAELCEAVADNSFPSEDGKALHLLFLEGRPAKPDLVRLSEHRTGREEFMLNDKVFYLYTPDGFGRSKLARSVERCLGVATTGRNWNTVVSLVSMMSSHEGIKELRCWPKG